MCSTFNYGLVMSAIWIGLTIVTFSFFSRFERVFAFLFVFIVFLLIFFVVFIFVVFSLVHIFFVVFIFVVFVFFFIKFSVSRVAFDTIFARTSNLDLRSSKTRFL